MSKGEETRQHILEEAIDLFNTKGYQATSFSDITARTGVQKGGIYNHFANKEALTLEAFTLATDKVRERSREFLQHQPHTLDRIKAVVTLFGSLLSNPVVAGGCPLLNASVEADDASPVLRNYARAAMDEWRTYIIRSAEKGIARGEIANGIEPDTLATLLLSALEGGIMLSKLYGDHRHIHAVVTYWHTYLESLRQETP